MGVWCECCYICAIRFTDVRECKITRGVLGKNASHNGDGRKRLVLAVEKPLKRRRLVVKISCHRSGNIRDFCFFFFFHIYIPNLWFGFLAWKLKSRFMSWSDERVVTGAKPPGRKTFRRLAYTLQLSHFELYCVRDFIPHTVRRRCSGSAIPGFPSSGVELRTRGREKINFSSAI